MGRNNKNKNRKQKQPKNKNEDKKLEMAVEANINSQEIDRMGKIFKIICGQYYDEDIVGSLATLSGFVLEAKGAELFDRLEGAVKVAPCLAHSNAEVREKAVGVLSNYLLSNEKGLKHIFNSPVVPNLLNLFTQAYSILKENTIDLNTIKDELNVLDQSLQLLTSLCEVSSSLVENLEIEMLLPFLILLVSNQALPLSLQVTAATCLYTVSEENRILTSLVAVDPDRMQALFQLITTDYPVLTKVLSAGTLINVCAAFSPSTADELIQKTLTLAVQCLSTDVNNTDLKANELSMKSQDVILEILSNMVCEGEGSEEEDWEDLNSEDEMEQQVEEQQIQPEASLKLLETMFNLQLPQKVISLCNACIVASTALSDNSYTKTLCRSWQYLSNLVSSSPVKLLGGVEQIDMLWTMLSSTILDEKGEVKISNTDVFDATCTAMRSFVGKMVESNPEKACSADVVQLVGKLLTIDNSCADSAKMCLVNVLGMIGKETGKQTSRLSLLTTISGILVQLLLSSTESLLLKTEAVDASIDTFSEDHTDSVLQNTHLFGVLKEFSKTFKAQIQSESEKLGERANVADMVRVNLTRFLAYKQNNI